MRKPPKKTLENWSSMTDGNEHGLVREEIAKWMKENVKFPQNREFDYMVQAFHWINDFHAQNGSIPHELCIIRNFLTNELFDAIKDVDSELADTIEKCL